MPRLQEYPRALRSSEIAKALDTVDTPDASPADRCLLRFLVRIGASLAVLRRARALDDG